MQGRYFIWDGALLYAGPGGRSALHMHHLIQIGVAEDRAIKVRSAETEKYALTQAFVLDADVPHQVVCASEAPIYFLWLDPESERARRLYSARPELRGDRLLIDAVDSHVAPTNPPSTCKDATKMRHNILEALGAREGEETELDDRVRAVFDVIRDRRGGRTPSVDELAEIVFLSPSRLMHVFSEQVGIPIRRYVLWRRIMTAIEVILKGASLTEAAIDSGFADSAHMSRTFKEMFGVSPSALFKNSRFIQAIRCSAA